MYILMDDYAIPSFNQSGKTLLIPSIATRLARMLKSMAIVKTPL